jgi:hypothetical protein
MNDIPPRTDRDENLLRMRRLLRHLPRILTCLPILTSPDLSAVEPILLAPAVLGQSAANTPVPARGQRPALSWLNLLLFDDAATTSRYVLPSGRTTVWNPGLAAVGGIPTRTTVFRTITPSGSDDTAAIQNALDACPSDQVVQLTVGTFQVSGEGLTLRTSNITLRGAGANNTHLVQAADAQFPVIIIGQRWYKWFQQTALTADAQKGAKSVTLASNPGLSVGELVHVSETYDPLLVYYNPDTQNGDYQGWGEGRQGPQSQSRPVGQAMEVASISGNTVTFTTPFHISYRTSHSAHLARISDGSTLAPATQWSGIESLSVENGSGGDGGGNIRVFASMYSWAKNIESHHSIGAAFALDGAFRCELRDSYLHSTPDPNPGGAGYGIVLDSYTADSLIENNISWNFNKVMAMRSSGGGNVIGYNYFEDGYGGGYPTIVEVGLNGSHMAGSHHELFEGNQAFNFDSDSYWGTQIYFTVFRNHLTTLRRSMPGVQVALSDEMNRRGIGLTVNQWWHSFVGNVIGYPEGYLQSPAVGHAYPASFSPEIQSSQFAYEWLGGPFDKTPIWQLGYDGSHWYETQDALVQARTLRDANFDYFTRAVHWHGVGGTGVGAMPNPAPTLPNSLYLTTKPAFFGTGVWPWVDGGSAANPLPGTLPARMRFDAGVPNG